MVEPVNAAVKEEQVDKLIETLGGLRAEQIVSDTAGSSAYGLHDAAVTVTLTYKPPTEHRIEPTEGDASAGGDDGDPQKATPVEVQPPSRTLTLAVTKHDGKHYAKLTGRPTIYEVSADFYNELVAEYRTDRVLEFDDAEVGQFSIRSGEDAHMFVRVDERWTYQAEPDLPLDDSEVKNLLLQIRDLRTPRYVRYAADDLAAFGLSAPAHEVTVSLEDGTDHTLLVSNVKGNDGTENGFYAMMKNRGDVFLLPTDATKRFEVSLEDLERPTQ